MSLESRLSRAQFVTAAHRLDQLPADTGVEVAFAGRSNAGKSSAINVICHRKNLARTSRTPGRTQQMVIFELEPGVRLVDLPGYGYAKVPLSLKRHWETTLDAYLRTRRSLAGVVLIMDARHPLKDFDCMMLDWAREADLACHVLITKADKLKRGAQAETLRAVKRAMAAEGWRASFQLFSAQDRMGLAEAREVLAGWLDGGAGEGATNSL